MAVPNDCLDALRTAGHPGADKVAGGGFPDMPIVRRPADIIVPDLVLRASRRNGRPERPEDLHEQGSLS